ncbi:hypothetical protein M426DRAFT_70609 [Hypoxylon sp. CI-4A]|nr:hypothetical protein M426DRAFT_70609 [Hypoxylon sp. CI-4A]
MTSSPRVVYSHCIVQRCVDTTTRIRVGHGESIPRWVKGSTIKYVVYYESFGDANLADFVAKKAAEATGMWMDIGVKFEEVPRDQPATFQIYYFDLPADGDTNVGAESFYPQDKPGTLSVYKVALRKPNIEYLANILAHEIGHILGLRHEFAGEFNGQTKQLKEVKSLLWGKENRDSIMNYFKDVRQYVVRRQDLEELNSFYNLSDPEFGGLVIRNFEPRLFWF